MLTRLSLPPARNRGKLKLGHPRGATTILRPTDWPIFNLLKSRLKK
jgi:hypothetical protein